MTRLLFGEPPCGFGATADALSSAFNEMRMLYGSSCVRCRMTSRIANSAGEFSPTCVRSVTSGLHKRAPYPPKFDEEQVALNEKAPTCGAFAEPSSGLEPETPSLPCAPISNWSQPTATALAFQALSDQLAGTAASSSSVSRRCSAMPRNSPICSHFL
jgi:hypothetical protein